MSGKILALEKNTWIQAYQIRNFELGVLQKKNAVDPKQAH